MSSDEKRVEFQARRRLIDRTDALAAVLGADRTDILVTALREYLQDAADDDAVVREIAAAYYDDRLEFGTVTQLVGAETAQRLRLLEADLEDEPLDLAAPDDVDIYDGDATAIDTAGDDGR